MRADPIAVVEIDVEEVVLVACDAAVAASVADGTDGSLTHEPVDDVDVVDVGIEDVVAAEPAEIVPVSNHVGHVVPSGFPGTKPDVVLVPEGLGSRRPANGASLHPFVSFNVIFLVAALCACDDA